MKWLIPLQLLLHLTAHGIPNYLNANYELARPEYSGQTGLERKVMLVAK